MAQLRPFAALAGLLLAGCSLPHTGERGGYETYACRFKVRDADSGERLEGVRITVKDGIRSVAIVDRTDKYGEFTFRKQYGRRKAAAIRERAGYPRQFTAIFSKDGYRTLIMVMDERTFRFGLDRQMSIARKNVEIGKGTGEVKVDERGSSK